MLTIATALALAAAAQAAPAAPATNPHAQHAQTGQPDHSRMDHSNMGQRGGDCCKHTADGKMECQMMSGHGAGHQGGAGRQPQQGHRSGQ